MSPPPILATRLNGSNCLIVKRTAVTMLMRTSFTNDFTFAITSVFLMLILSLFKISDAKLWRYGTRNNKIPVFRLSYMRWRYDFCDRFRTL